MEMSDKTYDLLKWVAQIALPAIGAFVATIFHLYHLPYGEVAAGTIAALDVLLGALLKKSSDEYAGDGTLVVNTTDPDKDLYQLLLDTDPDVLAKKASMLLKVKQTAPIKE